MKRPTRFQQFLYEKCQGLVLLGLLLCAIVIWLYEYHYTVTGDDMLGVVAAGALFLGILVLGHGIRGWRDGEEWRNRYVLMKSKTGAEVKIKKRKKRSF
jgi:hypothetical protein